jgi:Zn-dependent peptidase ImmA (M78 family)
MILEINEGLKPEDVCNHFAGAFLINKTHFLKEVGTHRGSFSIKELLWLKKIYAVSMASIMIRARNLGIIESSTYLEWERFRSAKGWRTQEPDELPKEVSTVLERNVVEAFIERYITTSKAASLLNMGVDTFLEKYLVDEEKVIA